MAIKSLWNAFKLILTCPFVIFFTTIGSSFLFSNLLRLEKNQVFFCNFSLSPHQCYLIGKNLCGWTANFFPRPTSMHLKRENFKWLDGKFSLPVKPTFSSDFSPLMSALSKMAIFNFLSLKIRLYSVFPTIINIIS